jgi:hypothetical protein
MSGTACLACPAVAFTLESLQIPVIGVLKLIDKQSNIHASVSFSRNWQRLA